MKTLVFDVRTSKIGKKLKYDNEFLRAKLNRTKTVQIAVLFYLGVTEHTNFLVLTFITKNMLYVGGARRPKILKMYILRNI